MQDDEILYEFEKMKQTIKDIVKNSKNLEEAEIKLVEYGFSKDWVINAKGYLNWL